MEPVARHRAVLVAPRRSCSSATSTGPPHCSRETSAVAAATRQHRLARRSAEAELALLAMDRGRWAEAAEHVRAGARRHRRVPDARLRHQRARLRRRGPARRAPRRPEGGGPAAHAGDAGPSVLHLRPAVPRRAGPPAAGQGVPGHRRPDAPLVTCCGRSTTSCSTGRQLGALVDEVAELPPRSSPSSARRQRDRRVAPHPGGASAAALPADPPHVPRDRRAAVRLPQHRQLRGRLDLPEARASRPAATRCSRRPTVGLLGG